MIAEDVAALAPEVDHVIVLMHHGWENTSTVNDIQRANVDAAFDAGATVVLGHHPHVLQAAEHREDGRFVAYSLGNFVFDTYSRPTTESVILHLTLGRDGVVDHEVTPVRLVGGFPQPLDPGSGEGLDLLTRFEQLPVG